MRAGIGLRLRARRQALSSRYVTLSVCGILVTYLLFVRLPSPWSRIAQATVCIAALAVAVPNMHCHQKPGLRPALNVVAHIANRVAAFGLSADDLIGATV